MDLDEGRRKRRRLPTGSTTPPPPAQTSRRSVDLTGDSSPEPEDQPLHPGSSRNPGATSPRRAKQAFGMPLADDEALAEQLQAQYDLEDADADRQCMVEDDAALARRLSTELENERAVPRTTKLPRFEPGDEFPNRHPALCAPEIQATVREFVQPMINSKCPGCKNMLFKESDIDAYAQTLLDKSGIDVNAQTPLDRTYLDGTELNCRSCHASKAYPQLRAVMIWVLLCFFDSKSKHNKLGEKKHKSAKNRVAGTGTGYGGGRGGHAASEAFYDEDSEEAEDQEETSFLGSDLDLLDDISAGPLPRNLSKKKAVVGSFQSYGQGHTLDSVPHLEQSEQTVKSQRKAPNHTQSPPLNEDDSMTAKTIACLAKLLPTYEEAEADAFGDNSDSKILQSLLLCSSILERAADLLRNNNLEEVTRQAALYQQLIKFLETLSDHPSTSALVLGERVIRSPAANIFRISVGKEDLVNSDITDTTQPLVRCMLGLASQANIMLKTEDADAKHVKLFQSIKDLNDFLVPNAGTTKKYETDKTAWHKELNVLDVPDDDILNRHSLFIKNGKTPVTTSRGSGQMKRIMKEIALLKADLPPGIFVRYCETRPDVMKILIIGPKDTPYENGLFEFDLLCGPDFPQGPPKMDFRTTGGGIVHFNPNLYPDGKVCLSILGTWQGQPWKPTESTLMQVLVSIQAMIFCEKPWENEPGMEGGNPLQIKAYNRSLFPHTVQTAMLDWLEKRHFKKGPVNLSHPAAMYGRRQDDPIYDTSNIWAAIVERHFDENSAEIMATVKSWVEEIIPEPPKLPAGVIGPWGSLPANTYVPPSIPTSGALSHYLLAQHVPTFQKFGPGKVLGSGDAPVNADLAGFTTPANPFAVTSAPYGTGHVLGGGTGQIAGVKEGSKQQAKPPTLEGTGWQGKTLGGASPPVVADSDLVRALRDALPKLKSRAAGGSAWRGEGDW